MGAPIGAAAIRTLVAVALLVSGCGSSPSPSSGSRTVTFASGDGVSLSGRLFGPDDAGAGVVLAHMFPSDQSAWYPFAERLASRGYRVLTFNFRGYCPGGEAGCSEGEKRIPAAWQDVVAGVEALRDEGVSRIGLVGASMGGTATLIAAAREDVDVAAVVTLSAPISFEGLSAGADVLAQVSAAKLFIAGHEDTGAAQAVDVLYAQTLQPKRPVILTTGDHGTDILEGNQAGLASTEIVRWLERYLPPSGGTS